MARLTPHVQQGLLYWHESTEPIAVGSPAWFSWLAEHSSFRFTSPVGTLTARRETRASGWYWYAYRRRQGSLHSAYLGKTEGLTLLRLTEAANRLDGMPVPGSSSGGMAEPGFLLISKITPPRLPPSLVARPRLLASLSQPGPWKLLLVTGPAGSGKTTVLATILRELSCSAAWLSLDDSDNNLAQFWRYLLATLHQQIPGLATQLLAVLPTLQPETLEPLLVILINALATLPEEVVLVLDDFHHVTSRAVQDSVTFLIEHGPDNFKLIVASRTRPAFPLPRLRAQGLLSELSFADLRFTYQETRELLRRLTDIEPSTEELSCLLASTEGWVTGLALAVLASRSGPREVASTLGSPAENPAAFEYLASEVLAHLPEGVCQFLLAISILDSFNGALCDTVTLQQDSHLLLHQLEQENLFVTPVDDHHRWYRFHQLFAAFLRSHLDQRYPGRAEVLRRRAAAWYAYQQMPAEAIEYARRAGDFTLAADLIEQQGHDMLMRHEVLGLRAWLHALPEEVVSARPRLCVYTAWTLLHTSQMLPLEDYLSAAERGLASASLPVEQRRALGGEIAAIRARLAIYQNRTMQSVELAQQALLLISGHDNAVRSEVALSLGATYEVLGDLQEAEMAYHDAILHGRICGNLRTAMLATRSLAILNADQGRLVEARHLYQDALNYALQTQQENLPPVGFLHVGLGELCYERNDLDAAELHFREGIMLGQRGGDVKIWLLGSIGLILTSFAQGYLERSWSLLTEAERQAQETHFQRGIAWLQSIRIRLSILHGDVTPLLDWMKDCSVDAEHVPDVLHEEEYQQLAQALIADNDPVRALHLLKPLIKEAERAQRYGRMIPLLLDQARAYARRGESGRAAAALSQALTLAEPHRYVRTFLDAGTEIASLMQALQRSSGRRMDRHGPYPPRYLKQLLAQMKREQAIHVGGDSADLLSAELSPRELEVLRLLAEGYSNADIAGMLVIGLNTVKTHIKHIYSKLGVHTRTQALASTRTSFR